MGVYACSIGAVEISGRRVQPEGVDFEPIDLDLSPGETLFGQSTGVWRHVTKTRSYADESLYTIGFKDAADSLVVQAVEQGMQDFFLMPVLYLYRHALELELKELIYLGQSMHSERREVWSTHNLEALWKRARAVLEEGFPHQDRTVLDSLEARILELASVDRGGELFRYAHDKEGVTWELPPQLASVDLVHVRRVMGKVLGLLAGGIDGISDLAENAPRWDEYYDY